MVSQTLIAIISTVKFVEISRPDSRDPDFNREESSHHSPYHPQDAKANGAPTTLRGAGILPSKKLDASQGPMTGVQDSGGGVLRKKCSILSGELG